MSKPAVHGARRAKLFDASSLVGLKYGCTEYAVKRLTGRDLLEETGLPPKKIGFENIEALTGGQCAVKKGTDADFLAGKLNGAMLRIHPTGQKYLHTVVVIDGRRENPVIEDQVSRRAVPAGILLAEWESAGQRYARCTVI